VDWGRIHFGEKMQHYARYAHCLEDIHLLSTFLDLAKVPEMHGDGFKVLLHTLKLLRLCDYSAEDICSVLAHASEYFGDVHDICGTQMGNREVANVLTSLLYIAHCFVHDETCPLHIWHQYLFRKYCPLKTLNAAVMRLMEILQYRLRLEPTDLAERYTRLTTVLLQQPTQAAVGF